MDTLQPMEKAVLLWTVAVMFGAIGALMLGGIAAMVLVWAAGLGLAAFITFLIALAGGVTDPPPSNTGGRRVR